MSRYSRELLVGKVKPTRGAEPGDTFGAAASRVGVVLRRSLPVPGDYNSQEAPRACLPAPPPTSPRAPAAMQMLFCGAANPRAGWRRHVARSFLSLCTSLSFLGRHLVLTACWAAGDPPRSGETFSAPVGTAPPVRPTPIPPFPCRLPGRGGAPHRGSWAPFRPHSPRWAVAGPRPPAVLRGEDGGARPCAGARCGGVCPGPSGGPRLSPRTAVPRAGGVALGPEGWGLNPLPLPVPWGWPVSRPAGPSPLCRRPGAVPVRVVIVPAALGPRSPAGSPVSFRRFPSTTVNAEVVSPSFGRSLMISWGRAAKCCLCVGRLEVLFHPLQIVRSSNL